MDGFQTCFAGIGIKGLTDQVIVQPEMKCVSTGEPHLVIASGGRSQRARPFFLRGIRHPRNALTGGLDVGRNAVFKQAGDLAGACRQRARSGAIHLCTRIRGR